MLLRICESELTDFILVNAEIVESETGFSSAKAVETGPAMVSAATAAIETAALPIERIIMIPPSRDFLTAASALWCFATYFQLRFYRSCIIMKMHHLNVFCLQGIPQARRKVLQLILLAEEREVDLRASMIMSITSKKTRKRLLQLKYAEKTIPMRL
ncbi:hypothetical protein BG22_10270 [Bifidobacterium sp. UTBIF-78]|nr:hypothetical protein BG22_10270 [Bifidobacterium sp. UTBIF-78]